MNHLSTQRGNSDTNTILIVAVLIVLVLLAAWWFRGNSVAEPAADDTTGVDIQISGDGPGGDSQ